MKFKIGDLVTRSKEYLKQSRLHDLENEVLRIYAITVETRTTDSEEYLAPTNWRFNAEVLTTIVTYHTIPYDSDFHGGYSHNFEENEIELTNP